MCPLGSPFFILFSLKFFCSLFLIKEESYGYRRLSKKDISGKILYLASLFKGIKDHLKILNEMDELTGVESQMFTILNDLQLGINELCILYEKIEKLEK